MQVKPYGNGNQKLTAEKVLELRQRYQNGETQQVLAKAFDISQVTVSNIINYRAWKDSALKDHEIQLESQSRQIRDLKSKNTKLEKRTAFLEERCGLLEELTKVLETEIDQLKGSK